MTTASGTPVIVVELEGIGDTGELFHLPANGKVALGRPVTLDAVLAAGGCPRSWRTACGLQGHVFIYNADYFHRRRACTVCVARVPFEEELEAEVA